MSVRALLVWVVAWLALALPAGAQGFAGLGTDAEGFARVLPDRPLTFPADHGAHPGFRIEWWYVTANLTGADGQDYGIQWTLFRSALAPGDDGGARGWETPQLWMGHAALTTPDAHLFGERLARGGVGQAGVETAPFRAWIDGWAMAGAPDLRTLTLTAATPAFSYDLRLATEHAPVPHGAGGYSVKSEGGQASHYYSQPFYTVDGTLDIDGRTVPVTGQAWLDREWSSQPLAGDQEGWDWLSLHLSDGRKLMAFQLRSAAGAPYTSGTLISPDGTPHPLGPGAIILTAGATAPVAGRRVPVGWRVEVPGEAIDVTVAAINPGAWMGTLFAYWEGPVRIGGSHGGRGYLEMTGYR